jgi:Zn-dependent protease
MLIEPAPTPYDLRFHLFGTSVRVHPLFWLVMAIFGWPLLNKGFIYLGLWMFCGFVSILLHEFGHVWAGKAFGADGYIVLYGLGGLAVGASDVSGRWRRVVVYLAGPLIQLLGIFLPLYLWVWNLTPEQAVAVPSQVKETVRILILINLFWPLLNLVPVWPLDGGRVTREVCSWLAPGNGVRASLVISVVTAGLLAVNALVASQTGAGFIPYVPAGDMFTAFFFGIFAFESFQALQQVPPWRRHEPDDRLPWEREHGREREPWEG